MSRNRERAQRRPSSTVLLVALIAVVTVAVFGIAPTDITMGPTQRILYIHVAVAWYTLFAFVVMAVCGALYLRQRELEWDAWTAAAAELGFLCSTLTLGSGIVWARQAWGVWWTWDPRLTTFFVLWLIYTCLLVVRQRENDMHGRARISAVIALLGLFDIPLVAMATRWFRGLHPVSPQMEPMMLVVLLTTVACFTVCVSVLMARRQAQLRHQLRLAPMMEHAELEPLESISVQ